MQHTDALLGAFVAGTVVGLCSESRRRKAKMKLLTKGNNSIVLSKQI